MVWLILLALAGLLAVQLAHFFRNRNTFANSGKDSRFWLLGGLAWLFGLMISTWFLPSWQAVAWVSGGWIVIAIVATVIQNLRHGGQLPLADMSYVPVMLRFCRCYVRSDQSVQVGTSCEIQIGLTEHSFDIKLQCIQTRRPLEEMLKDFSEFGGQFDFSHLDERAMIAGGGVDPTSSLTVRVRGPAFRIDPPTQRILIADLVRQPACVVVVPEEDGDQRIRVEFVDTASRVRAGMTFPVRVLSKPVRLLPEWIARLITYMGTLIVLCCVGILFTAKAMELIGK